MTSKETTNERSNSVGVAPESHGVDHGTSQCISGNHAKHDGCHGFVRVEAYASGRSTPATLGKLRQRISQMRSRTGRASGFPCFIDRDIEEQSGLRAFQRPGGTGCDDTCCDLRRWVRMSSPGHLQGKLPAASYLVVRNDPSDW